MQAPLLPIPGIEVDGPRPQQVGFAGSGHALFRRGSHHQRVPVTIQGEGRAEAPIHIGGCHLQRTLQGPSTLFPLAAGEQIDGSPAGLERRSHRKNGPIRTDYQGGAESAALHRWGRFQIVLKAPASLIEVVIKEIDGTGPRQGVVFRISITTILLGSTDGQGGAVGARCHGGGEIVGEVRRRGFEVTNHGPYHLSSRQLFGAATSKAVARLQKIAGFRPSLRAKTEIQTIGGRLDLSPHGAVPAAGSIILVQSIIAGPRCLVPGEDQLFGGEADLQGWFGGFFLDDIPRFTGSPQGGIRLRGSVVDEAAAQQERCKKTGERRRQRRNRLEGRQVVSRSTHPFSPSGFR